MAAPASAVDAPGRLVDDQHAGLAQDLAADDEFLEIAAGQRSRGRVGRADPDVEGADHRFRDAARDSRQQEAAAG